MRVELAGQPSRTGPLTWGQTWQRGILTLLGGEAHRLNLGGSVPIPAGSPMSQVQTGVREVLLAFDSLRTLVLIGDDGRPTQQVLGELSVDLPLVHCAYDQLPTLKANLKATPFNVDTDLPIRFQLAATDRGELRLLYALSHLASDSWAARRLTRELFAAIRTGHLSGEWPEVWQPCDRSAWEASTRGQQLSARNEQIWLHAAHAGELGSPRWAVEPPDPGSPRFREAVLWTPDLPSILNRRAREQRVSPSVLLLASLASSLGQHFDVPRLPFRIAFSNRTSRRNMGVETLMQWGLALLDAEAGSEAVALQETAESFLRAMSGARYDTTRLNERLTQEYQNAPPTQFWYNYVDDPHEPPLPQGKSHLPSYAANFSVTESHENDSDGLFYFTALMQSGEARLEVLFDSSLLDDARIEQVLRNTVHQLL